MKPHQNRWGYNSDTLSKPWNLMWTCEDTILIPSASHETSCGEWGYSYDTLSKPWNLMRTVKIQLWYPHQALKPLVDSEDTVMIPSSSLETSFRTVRIQYWYLPWAMIPHQNRWGYNTDILSEQWYLMHGNKWTYLWLCAYQSPEVWVSIYSTSTRSWDYSL